MLKIVYKPVMTLSTQMITILRLEGVRGGPNHYRADPGRQSLDLDPCYMCRRRRRCLFLQQQWRVSNSSPKIAGSSPIAAPDVKYWNLRFPAVSCFCSTHQSMKSLPKLLWSRIPDRARKSRKLNKPTASRHFAEENERTGIYALLRLFTNNFPTT